MKGVDVLAMQEPDLNGRGAEGELASPAARALIFFLLALLGVASIRLIDQRVITRMHQTRAIAQLPDDSARKAVQTMAEDHLRQRWGEEGLAQMEALVPMQNDLLRWTVLFVPETKPGDPVPEAAVQVQVDAATGRVQYVRVHQNNN